ncbi:MAG: hypothetical protein O3C60_20415 [Planctomycetota bacterium]|nr:hypothetical protein [Planctomycetota bacterium]
MSKQVTLTLSPAEYAALVDMIQIADWVITAHEEEAHEAEDVPQSEPYRALRNKVLSHVEGTDLEDRFEYNEVLGGYAETAEYEVSGRYRELLDEFENRTFWEELVERLADRDLVDSVGEDAIDAMSVMERYEVREPYCETYAEEFKQNGLSNLRCR